MIVDCVLYNGETDLLRLRLDTLQGVCDFHVVVEGAETFSGQRKHPGLLREPWIREYAGRIIYIVPPLLSDAPSAWHREAHQRNAIVRGLAGVPDEAIVLIGDVDEIPDPAAIDETVAGMEPGAIIVYEQTHHAYDARNVRDTKWRGTCEATAATVRRLSPEGVRRRRMEATIWRGGWHFTHMGSIERLKAKIAAFSHQEFNTPAHLAMIAARRAQGVDPFGRDERYTWHADASLPAPLTRNPAAYPMLWRDEVPA